jgi:hypothetical protein
MFFAQRGVGLARIQTALLALVFASLNFGSALNRLGFGFRFGFRRGLYGRIVVTQAIRFGIVLIKRIDIA